MSSLSKKNEVIVNDRPDYLKEYEKDDYGTTELLKVVRPPMIRIVQALTGPPIKPPYDVGDVVVNPPLIRIGGGPTDDIQDAFEFTPVFFFRNWFTWNPLQMKNQLPSVRAVSFDEDGEIAKKASNPNTRKEPCPENPEYKMSHNEHLNYIILVDNSEIKDIPVLMSFSRAEYFTGSNFGSLLQVRRSPIYCCRFQATVKDVVGTLGSWKGFDISNAHEQWVDKEEAARNKDVFTRYKELHEARLIDVEAETELSSETSNEFA